MASAAPPNLALKQSGWPRPRRQPAACCAPAAGRRGYGGGAPTVPAAPPQLNAVR